MEKLTTNKRSRKNIAELWDESDAISLEIITKPWLHPFAYLAMLLNGEVIAHKRKQKNLKTNKVK